MDCWPIVFEWFLILIQKVASEKSAQTLLGEFYKDREFLEQIASDETLQSLDMNDQAESVLQIIRSVFNLMLP